MGLGHEDLRVDDLGECVICDNCFCMYFDTSFETLVSGRIMMGRVVAKMLKKINVLLPENMFDS